MYSGIEDQRFLQDLSKKYPNCADLKQKYELQQRSIYVICKELKHFNINRIMGQKLHQLMGVMSQMGLLCKEVDEDLIKEICHRFNGTLNFGPELPKMAFSIREPVFNKTFTKMPILGFCAKIRLKSSCENAHLKLDGISSIPFNRGADVLLEIHPEDALQTAVFA